MTARRHGITACIKYLVGAALIIVLQAAIIGAGFHLPSNWVGSFCEVSAILVPFGGYFWLFCDLPKQASWPGAMRAFVAGISSIAASFAGYRFFLIFWFAVSLAGWPHRLPSEQHVREQFENHRADFVQLVALLQKDPSLAVDGNMHIDSGDQLAPIYHQIINAVGVKDVEVREDGSIEFAFFAVGCTICSDSFIGVRYFPKDHRTNAYTPWTPIEVSTLDSTKLPHENGSVASGLYVKPIEPNWYVYRLEIEE